MRCVNWGPALVIIEGHDNAATAYFLRWTRWGYFIGPQGLWGDLQDSLPLNATECMRFEMTGALPRGAVVFFAARVWREPAFHGWDGSAGRELLFRNMTYQDEHTFLPRQVLPIRVYKTLKRLQLEERENAHLWIIYKINDLDVGFDLPEADKQHHFPGLCRLCMTNLELSL